MTKEQLLAELEDLLRTMPSSITIQAETPENFGWLGRAAAVIEQWDPAQSILFRDYNQQLHEFIIMNSYAGFCNLMTMLHQARHDLRMQTLGPMNVAFQHGMLFDYFDEIRKIRLFAIIEATPKSCHTRLKCVFDDCVHYGDHTPSAGSV